MPQSRPTKVKKARSTEKEPKSFKCGDCPFATKTSSNLKYHTLKKHTRGIDDFLCKQCKQKFETKYDLDTHQQNDCTKMKGPCPKCDTFFATKGTLERHIKDNKENPKCGKKNS